MNPVSPELERNEFLEHFRDYVEPAYKAKHGRSLTWEPGWAWEALQFVKSALALQVEKEKEEEWVTERYVVESDGKMRVEHPPFLDGPEPQGESANEDEGRLAPCPFCGFLQIDFAKRDDGYGWCVSCLGCGVHICRPSRDEATLAWNIRQELPLFVLVEALQKIVDGDADITKKAWKTDGGLDASEMAEIARKAISAVSVPSLPTSPMQPTEGVSSAEGEKGVPNIDTQRVDWLEKNPNRLRHCAWTNMMVGLCWDFQDHSASTVGECSVSMREAIDKAMALPSPEPK